MNNVVEEITRLDNADKTIELSICQPKQMTRKTEEFDRIICTIPAPNCNWIDWYGFEPDISNYFAAFREMSYGEIFKLALAFRERFWENPVLLKPGFAVVGGGSLQDLPS